MPSSSFAPGEVVTEEELTPHAREWIAGYKVPKTYPLRAPAAATPAAPESPIAAY